MRDTLVDEGYEWGCPCEHTCEKRAIERAVAETGHSDEAFGFVAESVFVEQRTSVIALQRPNSKIGSKMNEFAI